MRLFRAINPLAHAARPPAARHDGQQVYLRPPVDRDWPQYAEIRAASRRFLEPWEPLWPPDALQKTAFSRRLRRYNEDWQDDVAYHFFIFSRAGNRLLGGIGLSNLRRGAAQTGALGYWIGEAHARQGHMTDGLGVMLRFCFDHLRLHRVEAACMPANLASQRLLRRCGFREEGRARHYFCIAGRWQDHILFARLVGDRLAGDRLAGDRLVGNRPTGDRLPGNRLAGNRPAATAPDTKDPARPATQRQA